MAISIAQAQKSYTFSEGSTDYVEFTNATTVFEQFGVKFLLALAESARKNKVVASGELLSKAKYRISKDGKTMQIMMPDYYDYPNMGVRGVKSHKNAPNSPYQYRSYGMNAEGRKSIKKYIADGHAKIENVRTDKAIGVGLEKKRLSVADQKANTLIYWIKRQGIKATHYFDEAVQETFKDFQFVMSKAIGKDIIFTIEKINKK